MNKNQNYIWFVIIGLAIVILGGAYLIWGGKGVSENIPVDQVALQTQGWNAHRDEEFNFRIKYPKDFYFMRNDDDFEGKFVSIRISDALATETGFTTDSSVTVLATTSPEAWCLTDPYSGDKPTETRNLAGTQVYYSSASEGAVGFKAEHGFYYLFKDNKCYHIEKQLLWKVGDDKDRQKVSDVLDLVVATFNFLD